MLPFWDNQTSFTNCPFPVTKYPIAQSASFFMFQSWKQNEHGSNTSDIETTQET